MKGIKMTQEEMKSLLELHEKWILNKSDGVRLDLSDADLRDANLKGANLRFADLRFADLRHANLQDANLRFADLSGTDLSGANLSGTILRRADLSVADLSGANLIGANLRLTDLRGANLSDADLSDTDLRWANSINAIGLDVICVQLNTSNKNRQIQYYVQLRKVTAGCFSGTLDELKKAVREMYDIDSVIYKRYEIAFKTIEDILETY